MKKFDKNHKINFVDANNVLVGFDMSSSCCEDFGWFYSGSPDPVTDPHGVSRPSPDTEPYVFDTVFEFEYNEGGSCGGNCGGTVVFRLTAPELPDLYLHLFNHHNGYYSHGFSMHIGNECIKEGNL